MTGSVDVHGWLSSSGGSPAGEAGTAHPLTVRVTSRQQPGAPALGRHPRAFCATTSAGEPTRSRMTCHRIAGSPASNQSVRRP